MRRMLTQFALITVPALVVLFVLLEMVFRFVIPAPDLPRQCWDPENNLVRYDTSARRDGVYTVGRLAQQRGRWHINNYGWISDIDYRPRGERNRPLIAVIGDSYVQALEVDSDKTFVALLREELKDTYDVYSFGISETPLSGYLQFARYVNRVFDPDILVITLVYNDFNESVRSLHFNPHFLQVVRKDTSIVEIPPIPRQYNQLKRVLFHSALMRYIYFLTPRFFNRMNWRAPRPQVVSENVAVDAVASNRELIRAATEYLMDRIVAENRGRRVYFVMPAPRQEIYKDALAESKLLWMNQMVREIAAGLDCTLIDQTDWFYEDYKLNKRRFESKYDGHWDTYGHYVTFRQLAEVLRRASADWQEWLEIWGVSSRLKAGPTSSYPGRVACSAGAPLADLFECLGESTKS